MVEVDGGKKLRVLLEDAQKSRKLLEQTKMGTANVCLTEMSPNVFFCVGYGGYGSACSRMQKPNLMILTVREQLKFHFPFCANVFKVLVST